MKMLFTMVALTGLLSYAAYAQKPSVLWQKTLGGSADDFAECVIQTNDNGLAVVGYTSSDDGDVSGNHGEEDGWVVKLDSNHNIQWQKTFGGSNKDEFYSIIQTNDGGYAIAGITYSFSLDGLADYWIVKLDANGNMKWQKNYGGSDYDAAYSIIQTSDGGYAVAGWAQSNDGDVTGNHNHSPDYWVVKLSKKGNLQWEKSYGGSSAEYAYSIVQSDDGGYVVAGTSNSTDGDVTGNHGDMDEWVLKIDGDGNIQWEKSLGGISSDVATSVIKTADGGYAVVGFSGSSDGDATHNSGGYDYWLTKLNSQGKLKWQNSFGGSKDDQCFSIMQKSNGQYVLAGFSYSNDDDVTGHHGSTDMQDEWIVETDKNGNLNSEESAGGTNSDAAMCVIATKKSQEPSNGNKFILAGYSASSDGDVTGNEGGYDYWVEELNPSVQESSPAKEMGEVPLSIAPNPSPGFFTITFDRSICFQTMNICNEAGEEVFSKQSGLDGPQIMIDLTSQPDGVYFLQANTGKEVFLRKLIVRH